MTLKNTTVVSMPLKEFRTHLRKDAEKIVFTTLARYRRTLIRELKAAEEEKDVDRGHLADAKVRVVEKRMRERIEKGDAEVQRRKAGTGKKVTRQFTYKDTPHNRKLERVGQTYEKVVYEDAEFEPAAQKLRRRKRPIFLAGEEEVERRAKAQRNNLWIRAVTQAKQELGAPGFVIIRKEPKDPKDADQVLGSKVYARARELMREMKEAAAADVAQPEPDTDTGAQAAAAEAEAKPAPKKRRRVAKTAKA